MMKPKNKMKLKACLWIVGAWLLTVVAAEIIYLVCFYDATEGDSPFISWSGMFASLIMLTLCYYIYERVIKRYANWVDVIDGKQLEKKKGEDS